MLGCEVANVKGMVFRARAGLTGRRDARAASCEEIRAELAMARRGGLRRGRLRHHLKACPGCSAYLDEVRAQRKMLALVLPVVPTLGLKESVLAATGIGGGAAAGGGGLLAGGLAAGGPGTMLAKVAVVGALAGGTGMAASAALDDDAGDRPPPRAPAAAPARSGPASAAPGRPAEPGDRSASGRGELGRKRGASRGRKTRRRGRGTPGASAPGRVKARGKKPKANAAPNGTARRPEAVAPKGRVNRPAAPPGRAKHVVPQGKGAKKPE